MNSRQKIGDNLDYVYLFTIFLYLIAVIIIDACRIGGTKTGLAIYSRLIVAQTSLLILSSIGELCTLLITALTVPEQFPSQAQIVQALFITLIWIAIRLQESSAWYQYFGASLIGMAFEGSLMALRVSDELETLTGRIQLGFQSIRLILLFSLMATSLLVAFRKRQVLDEGTQPILPRDAQDHPPAALSYGTESVDTVEHDKDDDDEEEEDAEDAFIRKRQSQRLKESGHWWVYLKGFSVFLPYLIPKEDVKVQLCTMISIGCLLINRALNVLVPRQLGIITDRLVSGGLPIKELGVWLVLNILDSGSGIGLINRLARIPIEQFSYREITNAAFNHVMDLSVDFHNHKDSAEVMKAIEQGQSLNNLLGSIITEIAPIFIDLFIGFIYVYKVFNAYMSITIFIASITYVYLEVISTNWNLKNRRRFTKTVRQEARVMHQAVQGWQTVSYFNKFEHEKSRFAKAVGAQLAAHRDFRKRDDYTRALKDLVVPLTFFGMSCLALFQISRGDATAGDYVFLIQYWDTLIHPVEFLSEHYRWLRADLIDAERLLTLFQTKPIITDMEGAKRLDVTNGNVRFRGVQFAYDPRKLTLEDINIDACAGETIALVGETGGGKSTILKLFYRFYDVSEGKIEIDGQDIKEVTLTSLRDALGVVPQDPVLFNTTVMENLRYARLTATKEEIYDACKAAAVHDKIMSFPDQYQSQVGEQGVKLSGGELQRVAIARVLLKDPPIVLLDEATSAVDTGTEASIQAAFKKLIAGRTTFVIAHRLSTVVTADKILVVHEGRIVERGTHQELLRLQGRYHALWSRQTGNGLDLI